MWERESAENGRDPDFWFRKTSMELGDACVGTSVRVQIDYREPRRQGSVGTIKKRYDIPNYEAYEVLFADGQTELFWDHQLEQAKESLARTKRRWVFW